jgi:hypothetical protein
MRELQELEERTSRDFALSLPSPLARPRAKHSNRFQVGGVSVQIVSQHSADVSFGRSLEPFRVDRGISDINVQVEWTAALSPTSGHQLFDSGSVWQLFESEAELRFDFSTPVLGDRPYKRFLVDRQFRRAILEMSEESFADFPRTVDPLEYPLDELLIMHRLTQEKAIELHGCGIVRPDGIGNLFVGHSEAGKSTTARLWTAHANVQILSDDRIIVRQDKARRGESLQDANQIFMYGTPWHGEAAFALPDRAPLRRIFILEHGRGNVLTRLTRSQAVAELFARSFVPFHRHEYVDSALSFLEHVADSVPCYRYAFEPDQRAVDRILNFHD